MAALWFSSALLPTGWARDVRVTLAGMGILGVDTGVAPGPDDERHGPLLPGLSNIHSHAFQRGMAGLSERGSLVGDNFWSWRESMHRFAGAMSPDDIQAVSALAFAEMAEAGFTRVGEFHCLHHAPDGSRYANIAEIAERITEASAEAGIGLTLLPVFEAHGDVGGAKTQPQPRQGRFRNDLDSFARIVEGCRHAITGLDGAFVGVAPHSLRAASPDEVAKGGPIHIRAAGQEQEVEACLAHLGARPVEFLIDHIGIDQRWCLVHATHMTGAETADLAISGAVAGLCPVTEANLGGGIFPGEDYLSSDGRFGIGTDSNIKISAADELRSLEYGQRLAFRLRNVLGRPDRSTGRHLFEGALRGGAQALGVRHAGLAPGAPADFFTLQAGHPSLALARGDGILDASIFAGAAIDGVWRGGRRIVKDGQHVAKARIVERYNRALAALAF